MGLLTQLIFLSTYLAKLHVSRNQDPKRTAAPKGMASPRGAADKLLGAARHSGQHLEGPEEALPVMQEQCGRHRAGG